MKDETMPRRLLHIAPVLALAVAGCGPAPYDGPARFPRVVGGEVGKLVPVAGFVDPNATLGAPAPAPVQVLGARCVDEAVCEAAVVAGTAVVGGRGVGATDVILDYEHPTNHTRHTERVAVRIAEPRLFPLAVGPHRDAPGGATYVLRDVKTVEGPTATYLCGLPTTVDGGENAHRFEVGDLTRGQAQLTTCLAPVRLPSGRAYLGSLPGKAPQREAPDLLYVCEHVKTRGADVLSIQIYRATLGADKREVLTAIDKRGEVTEICGLKR